MTNLLCMINRNHTSKYTYDLPTMYDKQNHTSKYTYDLPTMYDKQKSYIKIHI